jgi:hypothetical protein
MYANMGRWIFVMLTMIIGMRLGAVYVCSVFQKTLEYFFKITVMQSNLPFMIFIATSALFTHSLQESIESIYPENDSWRRCQAQY